MCGGQPLGPVALREGDEVGDLLPLHVFDFHQLPGARDERRAVPARDQALEFRRTRPRRCRYLTVPCAGCFSHGGDCASYIILPSRGPEDSDAGLGLDVREGIELTPARVVETPEVTHIRYVIGPRAKLEVDDRGAGG